MRQSKKPRGIGHKEFKEVFEKLYANMKRASRARHVLR